MRHNPRIVHTDKTDAIQPVDPTLHDMSGLMESLWEKYGRPSKEVARDIEMFALESLPLIARYVGGTQNFGILKVLDLGCGNNSGRCEISGFTSRRFEPWFCRALFDLGANVTGIDVEQPSSEKFNHYQIDLTSEDSLRGLPSRNFNLIHSAMFTNQLYEVTDLPEFGRRLTQQLDRVTTKDAIILPQAFRDFLAA